MAEIAVSALPVSSFCASASIIVANVGGTTSTVTRAILLTSNGAERIQLSGFASSYVMIESNGGIFIAPQNAQGFVVFHSGSGAAALAVSGVGDVEFTSHGVGTSIYMYGDGSELTLQGTGVVIEPNTGGTVFITYNPLTSGDWSGVPNSIWEALDRIAACVATLNGGPIP